MRVIEELTGTRRNAFDKCRHDHTREARAAAQAYDPGARAELWRRSLALTGHADIG